MKCPNCGYAYVKNIGRKQRLNVYDKKGKKEIGKFTHDNEKKYFCKKCGWKS